jgi:hypothetical protein
LGLWICRLIRGGRWLFGFRNLRLAGLGRLRAGRGGVWRVFAAFGADALAAG